MKNDAYKYSAETEKIIGAAIEVHNELGCGFPELIYQRALEIELNLRTIPNIREYEIPTIYKSNLIGIRRADFLVFEKITVELKARTELEPIDLAQAINHLEASHLEIGLLINFGGESLQVRRLLNKKLFKKNEVLQIKARN